MNIQLTDDQYRSIISQGTMQYGYGSMDIDNYTVAIDRVLGYDSHVGYTRWLRFSVSIYVKGGSQIFNHDCENYDKLSLEYVNEILKNA